MITDHKAQLEVSGQLKGDQRGGSSPYWEASVPLQAAGSPPFSEKRMNDRASCLLRIKVTVQIPKQMATCALG